MLAARSPDAIGPGDPAPRLPGPVPPKSVSPIVGSPPRPISVKLEGMVTAVIIENDQLQVLTVDSVDSTDVQVTERTTILPQGYMPIPHEDYVTIHALLDSSNRFVALKIRIRTTEDGPTSPIEFRGIITTLPAAPYVGVWTVAETPVEVNDRAAIIESPAIGFYAHVTGWVESDRSIRATKIQIYDPEEVAREFSFEGVIEELPAGESAFSTQGMWLIGGVLGLEGDRVQR